MEQKGGAAPLPPKAREPRCWNSALRCNVRFPPACNSAGRSETHGRSDFRPSVLFTTLRKTISESCTTCRLRIATSCVRRRISCLQRSSSRCSSVIADASWRVLLAIMVHVDPVSEKSSSYCVRRTPFRTRSAPARRDCLRQTPSPPITRGYRAPGRGYHRS